MSAHRTILIMAGGTGGHVFPGLAVADYLREQGWRVVWLGTHGGMEVKLVSQQGYDMELIRFSGARGKDLKTWLLLPWRLCRALWQSARVISRVQPDVVLGLGGYPALPGGLMAALSGRRLLIHEQNSVAGFANRILSRFADRILLGFPDAIRSSKTAFLGNPVRHEICRLPVPETRYQAHTGKLRLLVIGGSLGAQVLNTIVPKALTLIPEASRPVVTHQAGMKHLEALRKNYAENGVAGELVAFISDMAGCYAECDLVICRAGALTVAELAVAGVASILVPFPHAVDDHQTSNARFLSERDAAVLIAQHELTAQGLAHQLMQMPREKLMEIAVRARQLAKPDATRLVAEACMEMAG